MNRHEFSSGFGLLKPSGKLRATLLMTRGRELPRRRIETGDSAVHCRASHGHGGFLSRWAVEAKSDQWQVAKHGNNRARSGLSANVAEERLFELYGA